MHPAQERHLLLRHPERPAHVDRQLRPLLGEQMTSLGTAHRPDTHTPIRTGDE